MSCLVNINGAEREQRGSREGAEREQRGSREGAEREQRGSREGAEREQRDYFVFSVIILQLMTMTVLLEYLNLLNLPMGNRLHVKTNYCEREFSS